MKWYLGAVALLAVGLVFQLGLLVYAMYALIAVLLVSRLLTHEWTENVSASRECNRLTANIGEQVAVVLRLKNNGRMTVPWMIVEDSIPRQALVQRPPRLKLKRKRRKITRLKAGEELTLPYQVDFLMRGYYQIGPVLVESGDVFGLHRRFRILTEPHFVLVYPKVVPLQGYDISSRRPIGEVRMTHRLFEDPTRISGVRPYQTGDPLNRIHWRATARTGELHSKTYEPSSIAGATLLLDFHRDRYARRHEPIRSELCVTAAASLANAVYELGQQIGFVSNGRDAADRVRLEGVRHEFTTRDDAQHDLGMVPESDRLRPVVVETRRGADQLTRTLESLARVELTDGLTFPQLVTETASRLPRDATVVAILPDVPPETAVALGTLKRSGYAVTAILVMFPDEDAYPDSAGRLMAEGIDVRTVSDEEGLSTLCSTQMVG
ncbi:MAG: DUF58 domain-containing protein [Planctomycetaceae bacterium]